jgi:hypothetical protein
MLTALTKLNRPWADQTVEYVKALPPLLAKVSIDTSGNGCYHRLT